VSVRGYQFLFFGLFSLALICFHTQILTLPLFWDEQGQFVPTALDLLRHGWWVARSTEPNVHPPGMEVYLVLWYKVFGYSILVTRIAMLCVAGAGLFFTFLLAIELCRHTEGAPAFLPPMLLLASPLFYMQSMMAQLDMPAMVLTLLALLLFIKNRMMGAAIVCIALVLTKETGIVTPAIFGLLLSWKRDYRRATLFLAPAIALILWLVVLHAKTGYWLGNPEFAHYNVGYALQPVRVAFSLLRRCYYLFIAEFRWIGTLMLAATVWKIELFRHEAWRVTLLTSMATILLVSMLGGAELERYLLPVLPIFYIAVSVAASVVRKWIAIAGLSTLLAGLVFNLFWNPPYPFPYENNYAMVDFVTLQQIAARFAERNLGNRLIATAWPFSASLRNPDFGYVTKPLKVVETGDFHFASINKLPDRSFDALIVYTRVWRSEKGALSFEWAREFLRRFYDWQPEITVSECAIEGLFPAATWERNGQYITVYVRRHFH
jgi:hypothetical protein